MAQPIAIFVANRGFALYNSRLQLIKHLQNRGWKIIAATADDEYAHKLAAESVIIEPVFFHRGGFSIFKDGHACHRLMTIYKAYRPALIHHFHAKPVILGTLVGSFLHRKNVKIVNTITGLGHAFTAKSWLRWLASLGYRLSLGLGNMTIFQNNDDYNLFIDQGWTKQENSTLIISSGVDIVKFKPSSKCKTSNKTKFKILLVSRLIWQKGIREYIESAKLVIKQIPSAHFILAGEIDSKHPDAVPNSWLEQVSHEGIVEYIGYVDNLPELLLDIDLLIIPSYYREGVPRVILEAASCGIPTIGADVPGTREAINDGKTGFLVPPRDSDALAKQIVEVLKNHQLRVMLGKAARRKAEEQFDQRLITEQQLSVYKKIGALD